MENLVLEQMHRRGLPMKSIASAIGKFSYTAIPTKEPLWQLVTIWFKAQRLLNKFMKLLVDGESREEEETLGRHTPEITNRGWRLPEERLN
jgi:hypothetical protein